MTHPLPDPTKEALKRIRRVAALDLGDPYPLHCTRRNQQNLYGYQVARVIEYAMKEEY